MSIEKIELSVDGSRHPGELLVPDDDGQNGILVLPGGGHGPYGDVFDKFADEAAENGFHFLRYESWRNHEELGHKTLTNIHREIDEAVGLLAERGCSRISIVGKSLGGAIALTHDHQNIGHVALWAPAIIASDKANIAKREETMFEEVLPADNFRITSALLETIETPVRILHCTDDRLPIENSRKLVDGLPNAELMEIEGGDHAFNGEAVHTKTIQHTIEFLPSGA